MSASSWRCWVLIRHLIALDLNEAFLFSAIPIGEAAADNTKRLPAVRIDRVRAKKAESSGHRLFVLFAGASRAVVASGGVRLVACDEPAERVSLPAQVRCRRTRNSPAGAAGYRAAQHESVHPLLMKGAGRRCCGGDERLNNSSSVHVR